MNLQYRENNYFNNVDLFVFNNGLGKLWLSKVHLYNGNWYSNVALKYKMTSVRCINCKELYHSTVSYCGVEGIVSKFLDASNNDIGVQWKFGKNIKKNGLHNYWIEINSLKFE